MGFNDKYDKNNLENIINKTESIKNLKEIKMFLNEDGKIKENLSNNDIKILTKLMVLNIDFKNDLYIAFDFINNKSLNEDIFKFIVKHKDLEPEFYYYINYNPSCTEEIRKEILKDIAEPRGFKPLIQEILKKIDDKDILLKYTNDLDMKFHILQNKNLDNDIINKIIDNCLLEAINNKNKQEPDEMYYYKITNHFESMIENNVIDENNFSKLIELSKISGVSSFLSALAKKENITKEVIDYIATYQNENGETNSKFARTELIHNPNVDPEIKVKIIENQDKYEIYNSKNININDYINTLNDFFNK